MSYRGKNYLKRCVFILSLQIRFFLFTCFQLFLHQCLSSTTWWARGCAVWSKEPTPWCGWPYPEPLPELAAGSSSKVSRIESDRFSHCTYRAASFPFPCHPLRRIQTSSSPAGITCSDRLFVLQIAGLLRPTCLWPGPAALQRRSRVSWVSWRLWRSVSFSRSLMESSTDRPDLSLSELWRKRYTACHSPIKATITWMKVSFIRYV